MIDDDDRSGGSRARGAAAQPRDIVLPDGAVALVEFCPADIEHELGYFRSERFVVFGYCPGGGEVIWKDGHSSGFGAGGWRSFLEEIGPIGQRHGVDLGGVNYVGTHVLLIDRAQNTVYAMTRRAADNLLAQITGVAPPKRPCMCGLTDSASCPANSGSCADGPAAGESAPGATSQASAQENALLDTDEL